MVAMPDVKQELILIMADIQDGVSEFCNQYFDRYILVRKKVFQYIISLLGSGGERMLHQRHLFHFWPLIKYFIKGKSMKLA